MPQITVEIGGRSFDVICQTGEEEYLQFAAGLLNEEAMKLDLSDARITENIMLLMSGLLLADRIAAAEEKISDLDNADELTTLRQQVQMLEEKLKNVDNAENQPHKDRKDDDYSQELDRLRIERDNAVNMLEKTSSMLKKFMTDLQNMPLADEGL